MTEIQTRMNSLLGFLIELMDIPQSYYERAKERARSLEDWLRREGSLVAHLKPDVYPQGSFRYGTVIRPLFKLDEYDLDLVCAVDLSKSMVTQRQVKELIGHEIVAYAESHQFKEPAEEKPRCWRLNYADDVSFHMDILPSIPEDESTIRILFERRVPPTLAEHTIGITDTRHPLYEKVDPRWPSSNPRGIAIWFEDRARPAAQRRINELVRNRAYASIDEVPPYEWKTTLQRAIQILKRHRDIMFRDDRDLAPISMIITTLAAHAYEREEELYPALKGILERMPQFVRSQSPRVPNPVNPAEDFADRWSTDSKYERNFWVWHSQATADLDRLAEKIGEKGLLREVRERFGLDLTASQSSTLEDKTRNSAPGIFAAAPMISIPTAPKPWGRDV